MNRDIIFLSTSFPPHTDSHSIRNVFLVRGLVRRGWRVHVIRPRGGSRHDNSLAELLPANLEVIETRSPLFDAAVSAIQDIRPPELASFARRVFAKAAGMACVPDVRFDWTGVAVEAATSLLQRTRTLAIVSSSGSATAHIAASRVARDHGLKWIADFGDPWSFNPLPPANLPHIRFTNRLLERRVLRRCDTVTVTTERTARHYEQYFGVQPRFCVVPCGYSVATPESQNVPGKGGTISVSYIGTASRGSRDLHPAVLALERLASRTSTRIELNLVGDVSATFLADVRQHELFRIRTSAWVSYSESLRIMARATVLLMCGNKTPYQVPAKLFNYIASCRPIIYLSQMDSDDPSWDLLKGCPGVVKLDSGTIDSSLESAVSDLWLLEKAALDRNLEGLMPSQQWDQVGNLFADRVASTLIERPIASLPRKL